MKCLANFEVETQFSLAEGQTRLIFRHPRGTYEVHMRDLATEPGTKPPLLSVQIILEASDLRDAKEKSKRLLNEFLHILSFVTNGAFKIHRIIHVFDWSEGLQHRECLYFHVFPADEFPFPVLVPEHLNTAASIADFEVEPRLSRARKWFAQALSASYLDDKFTFFWFVVELVAQVIRDPAQVPDRCPRCRQPLWCSECGASPLHRPYPKQAIESLFHKFVNGDAAGFYKTATDARNRLLHGDEIEAIERAVGTEFARIVDDLGALAWTALLNLHKGAFENNPRPEFQTISRYTSMEIIAGTHMTVGYAGSLAEPTPEDAPKVEVTMHTKERDAGTQDAGVEDP